MDRLVSIADLPIRLDKLLKLAGMVGSGGQAKQLIQAGLVSVNGKTVLQRSKKIHADDQITVALDPPVKLNISR